MEKLIIKNKIKDTIKDLSNEEIERFVNALYKNAMAPKNDKELNELIDSLINSEYLFDDRELEDLGDDSKWNEDNSENSEDNDIPDFLKDRNSTQKQSAFKMHQWCNGSTTNSKFVNLGSIPS